MSTGFSSDSDDPGMGGGEDDFLSQFMSSKNRSSPKLADKWTPPTSSRKSKSSPKPSPRSNSEKENSLPSRKLPSKGDLSSRSLKSLSPDPILALLNGDKKEKDSHGKPPVPSARKRFDSSDSPRLSETSPRSMDVSPRLASREASPRDIKPKPRPRLGSKGEPQTKSGEGEPDSKNENGKVRKLSLPKKGNDSILDNLLNNQSDKNSPNTKGGKKSPTLDELLGTKPRKYSTGRESPVRKSPDLDELLGLKKRGTSSEKMQKSNKSKKKGLLSSDDSEADEEVAKTNKKGLSGCRSSKLPSPSGNKSPSPKLQQKDSKPKSPDILDLFGGGDVKKTVEDPKESKGSLQKRQSSPKSKSPSPKLKSKSPKTRLKSPQAGSEKEKSQQNSQLEKLEVRGGKKSPLEKLLDSTEKPQRKKGLLSSSSDELEDSDDQKSSQKKLTLLEALEGGFNSKQKRKKSKAKGMLDSDEEEESPKKITNRRPKISLSSRTSTSIQSPDSSPESQSGLTTQMSRHQPTPSGLNNERKEGYESADADDDFKPRSQRKIVKPSPIRPPSGLNSSRLSTLSDMDIQDSTTIRQAMYEDWRNEKTRELIRKKKLAAKKEQEETERKRKEIESKREEAKASFAAWKDNKKPALKQKKKEIEAKKKKEEEEEQEKRMKTLDAKKAYEMWKAEKDERLKEELKTKRQKELMDTKSLQDKEYMKRKDGESAYKKWNSRKEEVLKKKIREAKRDEEEKRYQEETMKAERDEESAKAFEEWEKKVEERRIRDQRRQKTQQPISQRPFRPSSNTIR